MDTKATLKDVARLSGVSIGTVDRVLHNRGKVSEENKKAVEEAAKALHYMPSQIARALVKQKLNLSIGISLLKADNSFWNESISGIKKVKNDVLLSGINVFVDQLEEVSKEAQIASIQRLLAKNVNAILLTPVETATEWIDNIVPENVPVVTVIDDLISDRKIFHIGPDDYAMGKAIAKLGLLYAKEEISIAIIAPNARVCGTKQRISGFKYMLEKNDKLDALQEIYEVFGETEKSSYQETYNVTEQILREHPEVNTIYVTNGATQWVGAAVKAARLSRKVFVFGHECTSLTESLIKSGYITATIYQRPELQWMTAIDVMKNYLLEGIKPRESSQSAECTILIEETLPLTKINFSF